VTNDIVVLHKTSDFGPFIKARRLELSMTQEDLAHAVNIMPHHVSRLENGLTEPKLSTVIALMRALDGNLVAATRKMEA
jgi:HTH-type transcriptional regulator / antitoxin HipB